MRRFTIFAAVIAALMALSYALAGEENLRFHDRQRMLVQTGEADIDASAADYTSFQALLTIAPPSDVAMHDVMVYLDTDKTTTGWNTVQAATTGQFVVARKVDGTNWRREVATIATATHGGNVSTALIRFDLGTVGPTEDVRIECLVSAEGGDVEIPYCVTYRSGASATFTAVAN